MLINNVRNGKSRTKLNNQQIHFVLSEDPLTFILERKNKMRPDSGPRCVNYENICTASSCTVPPPPPPHKFELNAFPNNARMENRIDLNLGMVVSKSIIYHIPDS